MRTEKCRKYFGHIDKNLLCTLLQKNDDRIQNPLIIKIVKVCCNRFKYCQGVVNDSHHDIR